MDSVDRIYGCIIISAKVSSYKNSRWRKNLHEMVIYKRGERNKIRKS